MKYKKKQKQQTPEKRTEAHGVGDGQRALAEVELRQPAQRIAQRFEQHVQAAERVRRPIARRQRQQHLQQRSPIRPHRAIRAPITQKKRKERATPPVEDFRKNGLDDVVVMNEIQ